jgi:hypothetical protein
MLLSPIADIRQGVQYSCDRCFIDFRGGTLMKLRVTIALFSALFALSFIALTAPGAMAGDDAASDGSGTGGGSGTTDGGSGTGGGSGSEEK